MKALAALLLAVLLFGAAFSNETTAPHTTPSYPRNTDGITESSKKLLYEASVAAKDDDHPAILRASGQAKNKTPVPVNDRMTSKWEKEDVLLRFKPFASPENMLLQEIRTLDEESSSNDKFEDAVAQTLKAEANRIGPLNDTYPVTPTTMISVNISTQSSAIKKILEDENVPYEDDLSEDEEDESDDEYNGDDDDEDDENEDDPEDDEQLLIQCPDYCRCAGEYAAVTTATCSKLLDDQSFGSGIVHLRIKNAGIIRLGPHSMQSRSLHQLKSITITDTRIVELNQTAFEGLQYLISVNLTRNDLHDIHPNTFQSNAQLTLLAISGNPLKHTQDPKLMKHGLFDAPSVTELSYTFNGLSKLKRNAFTKMRSLSYVNLKGNKLKEIDSATFNILDSLMELDLSNNLLNDVPADLFHNSEIQTLRIPGNNLASPSNIRAPVLRTLDLSDNKIRIITKDDFSGLPLLDQLILRSNGLKRIHQHAFSNLTQLTFLDISGNKLTSLMEHHLKTNARLQVILMNDNPELETLPVFKTIGFRYNAYSVYRFECSNCGLYVLEEGTFNAMPAIAQLNLSRNRLTGLPDGLLSDLTSLNVLDLSDNRIDSLKSKMFSGATSLTKINLAGNPLVTLQVTPFLMTPSLEKLDVSGCALERVWSEARVPLTSLRSLSVQQNRLRRITVEELKATPRLVSLDLSNNPLNCDAEFNEAVQWLTDHGVTPVERQRNLKTYMRNYGSSDNYQDPEGISQWTDLAKLVCDDVNDGPPERPVPHKENKMTVMLTGLDASDDADSLLRNNIENSEELLKLQSDHGIRSNEEVEKAWTIQDQEYEDFVASESIEYHPWYTSALWPVVIVLIITMMILLLTVHIAIHLARRRGRGPVIRPPMILRQGLIDNKNCGLVYKPLQEEIPTPHAPKRSSFYSSSTFHYDKIVPESV